MPSGGETKEDAMCKYSLELATAQHGTIDAAQGDNLEIRSLHAFQKVGEDAIVCLRTGTELTLTGDVIDWYLPDGKWADRKCEDVRDQAITFEEREVPTHWDAGGIPHLTLMDIFVRPDGRYTMIHYLCRGTAARVLQIPPVDFPVSPEMELKNWPSEKLELGLKVT
jgi:hypothetical protein